MSSLQAAVPWYTAHAGRWRPIILTWIVGACRAFCKRRQNVSMGMQEAAEVLQYCIADITAPPGISAEPVQGSAADGSTDGPARAAPDLPALGMCHALPAHRARCYVGMFGLLACSLASIKYAGRLRPGRSSDELQPRLIPGPGADGRHQGQAACTCNKKEVLAAVPLSVHRQHLVRVQGNTSRTGCRCRASRQSPKCVYQNFEKEKIPLKHNCGPEGRVQRQ